MAREEVLTVKVKGKMDPTLKRGLGDSAKSAKMLAKNIDNVGKEVKKVKSAPVKKLRKEVQQLGKVAKSAEKSVFNMGNAVKVLGAVATGVAVRGILKISDDFERARSRMLRFGETTEEQTRLFKKLREAAIRVGANINDFSSQFSKFAIATKRFNLSGDQMIRTIEGLNQALDDAGERGSRFRRTIGTIIEVLQRAEDPSAPLLSLLKTGETEGLLDDIIKEYARLTNVDIAGWAKDGAANIEFLNRIFKAGEFDRPQFLQALLNTTDNIVSQGPQIVAVERSWASLQSALADIVGELFRTSGALEKITGVMNKMVTFIQRYERYIFDFFGVFKDSAVIIGIGVLTVGLIGLTGAVLAFAKLVGASGLVGLILGGASFAAAQKALQNFFEWVIDERARIAKELELEHPVKDPRSYSHLAPPEIQEAIETRKTSPALAKQRDQVIKEIRRIQKAFNEISIDYLLETGQAGELSVVLEGLNNQMSNLGVSSSRALEVLPALNSKFLELNDAVRASLGVASVEKVLDNIAGFFDQVAEGVRPLSDLEAVLARADSELGAIEIRFGGLAEESAWLRDKIDDAREAIRGMAKDAQKFTEARKIKGATNQVQDAITELRRSRESVKTGGASTGQSGTLAQAINRGKAVQKQMQFQLAVITDASGKQTREYFFLNKAMQQLNREIDINIKQLYALSGALDEQGRQIDKLLKKFRNLAEIGFDLVLDGIVNSIKGIMDRVAVFAKKSGIEMGVTQNILVRAGENFIKYMRDFTDDFKKARDRLVSGDPDEKGNFPDSAAKPIDDTLEKLGISIKDNLDALTDNFSEFIDQLVKDFKKFGEAALIMVILQVVLEIIIRLFEQITIRSKIFAEGLQVLFLAFDVIIDVVAQVLKPVFDILGYVLGELAIIIFLVIHTFVLLWNVILWLLEKITFGLIAIKRVRVDLTLGRGDDDADKDKKDKQDDNIQQIKINTDRLLELENQFLRASLTQNMAINELQRVFEASDAVNILEVPNLQEQRQLEEDKHARDRLKAQLELDETLKKRKNLRDEAKNNKDFAFNNGIFGERIVAMGEAFDGINEYFKREEEAGGLRKAGKWLLDAGDWVVDGITSLFSTQEPIKNTYAYAPPPNLPPGIIDIPPPTPSIAIAPTPRPGTAQQTAVGGSYDAPGLRSSMSDDMGGMMGDMKVYVTIDRDAMERYLSSTDGEQVILNQIRINSDDVREIVA